MQEFTNNGVSVTAGAISNDPTNPPILPANYIRRNMVLFHNSENNSILMADPSNLYSVTYSSPTSLAFITSDISGDLLGGSIFAIAYGIKSLLLVFATTGVFTYFFSGSTPTLQGRSAAPEQGAQVPLELFSVSVTESSDEGGTIISSCSASGVVSYDGSNYYYYVRIAFAGATVGSPATVKYEPFTEFPSGPYTFEQASACGAEGSSGFRLFGLDDVGGIVSSFQGLQTAVTYKNVAALETASIKGANNVVTLDNQFPALTDVVYDDLLPPSTVRFSGSSLVAGSETGWAIVELAS